MMNATQYTLVMKANDIALEADVNTKIKQGWQPIGGITYFIDPSFGPCYMQAMVRIGE
jgi:hypothetical protein